MVFQPKLFRQRVALFSAILIVAAVGVWRLIVPAEPVYEGRPLSEWLDGKHEGLTREQLKTLGPGAVKWLAYQAKRSRAWSWRDFDDTSPLAKLRLWLHVKRYGEEPSKADNISDRAVSVLGELGPDAAAAVPALLQTVRDSGHDNGYNAADSLCKIGPASWPAVSEAIRHGALRQRLILIIKLPDRSAEGLPPQSPDEFTQMVTLLFEMTRDPDVGAAAFATVKECVEARRGTPELNAGIRAGAEEMKTLPEAQQRLMADVFARLNQKVVLLEQEAAAAVPVLKALAETGDELTRAHIVGALAVLDWYNPKWTDLLNGFAASPNKDLAAFAEQALHPGRR